MDSASRLQASALELLDDLDTRHDKLLNDLDSLLNRVEGVLEEYACSRGKPVETYKAKVPSANKPLDDEEYERE